MVAAGPGETCDQTETDRVLADGEDNWNGRGCRLGHERPTVAESGDHGDPSPDQVSRQLGEAIQTVLGPAIEDGEIVPLDKTGFPQPCMKSAQAVGSRPHRAGADVPDHRQDRLLRPRRARPHRRRAAEQRDELAPFQLIELHPLAQPTPGQHIASVRVKSASRIAGFRPG
jgi:hypothetical protein